MKPADFLDRLHALEVELNEFQTAHESLLLRLTTIDATMISERNLRTERLNELRQSLLAHIDSVSTGPMNDLGMRLERQLDSLRATEEQQRLAIKTQLDDLNLKASDFTNRLQLREQEVSDSLSSVAMQLQEEQVQRRIADQRTSLVVAVGVVFLSALIGLVWWRGQGQLENLTGHVRTLQPNPADFVEEARQSLAADIRRESWQLLREQLQPLETISSMLDRIQSLGSLSPDGRSTPDHDLPLAVCNEVNRIEKNLLAMDASVRGHKKLVACVRRVKDNLNVHGYEITELLGKPFHNGMEVRADFVTDDRLAEGDRLITRIMQPEVRFGGKIVQNASIRVSERF